MDDTERADAANTNDEEPIDLDALRLMLARRFIALAADRRFAWRDCPERSCRRNRHCQSPHARCRNLQLTPSPRAEPDDGRAFAHFQQKLRERLAMLPREEAAASAAREVQSKLSAKRNATRTRKSPNPISRPRRGSQCASRTP